MSRKVHKKIELVGSSDKSIEDALQNAVNFASQTLRNLDWFEVVQVRGNIEGGKIANYQVTFQVGFRMEGSD
jgi:dodecin